MSDWLREHGFTDGHHHLWDLGQVHYPWLAARGVKRFFGDPAPIQKNYFPDDLRADASPYEINASVHIQVGAEDSLEETGFVCGLGSSVPSVHVAEAQLQSGNIAHQLDQMQDFPKVKGVRQIVGRHPVEDAKLGTDGLISDASWKKGLGMLADRGLSFDLQMIASQYDRMHTILQDLPRLQVAICHFGSPWAQDSDSFDHWKKAMLAFAQLPGIYMKLSGFSMFRPDWQFADLARYINAALDIFGPERCMFGSNYPVDGLHRPYREILEASAGIVEAWDVDAMPEVFSSTASNFYRV